MTHTVDTLMALADAYAEVSIGSTTAHAVEMQEALRTALTEVFDQLDIQAGSIEAVQAANQRLAQAAQPVREPLTDKQISKLWSDSHNDTSDMMAFQVLAKMVEAAHGIGGDK